MNGMGSFNFVCHFEKGSLELVQISSSKVTIQHGSEIRLTQKFVDFSRWNPSHSLGREGRLYKILLEGQITTMLNSYLKI